MIDLLRPDWLGTICSTTGILLSMFKRMECWAVWLGGNACWIYYGYCTRQYSIVCLNVMFLFLNVLGYYMWKKSKGANENKSSV